MSKSRHDTAFLFDIGNVILPFDFTISARKLAARSAVSAEEILALVSPLTVDLELGRVSVDDFTAAASERIGYTGEPDFFRSALADIFDPNLPMIAFIEALKAEGVPLYLLSNTNRIHADFFEAAYPVFGLFDGGIYSHEVGLMKPDPAIYELAKTTLPLDPARTIYIDDLAANCVAGAAAGFQSVVYARERHAEFLDEVAAMLSRP
ncbi:MAG TPA: HAD family phosphatase [Bacteroidia bacterium]|nr:HAD family phosphatase [Bacteroidia bacterium]